MAYEPSRINKQFWVIVTPLEQEGLVQRAKVASLDEDAEFEKIIQNRPEGLRVGEYLGNVASFVLREDLDDSRRDVALMMAERSCGSTAVASAILDETRRQLVGIH